MLATLQLSPQAAYDQAMHPLEITRNAIRNWSDAELKALAITVKQAAEACGARTPEQFTADDLIAYTRLCALGQQWPTIIIAAEHPTRQRNRFEPRRFLEPDHHEHYKTMAQAKTSGSGIAFSQSSPDPLTHSPLICYPQPSKPKITWSIQMAKGVNKVFLLGRLGKDPEMRATTGGMTIASFTLATSDRQKDAQGNWQDKTEWHNLVAFQRTAEIVRDYCKKGSQIFIEGKIQTRSWDDKESGQKKYRTEILVNELSLLDSKSGSGEGASAGGYSKSGSTSYDQRTPASQSDYADVGITDDDIPF